MLIKPGPSAIVVAAVIGNPPQKLSNQLQLTLENIHSLYGSELSQFSGDNGVFKETIVFNQDGFHTKGAVAVTLQSHVLNIFTDYQLISE